MPRRISIDTSIQDMLLDLMSEAGIPPLTIIRATYCPDDCFLATPEIELEGPVMSMINHVALTRPLKDYLCPSRKTGIDVIIWTEDARCWWELEYRDGKPVLIHHLRPVPRETTLDDVADANVATIDRVRATAGYASEHTEPSAALGAAGAKCESYTHACASYIKDNPGELQGYLLRAAVACHNYYRDSYHLDSE